MNASDPAAQPIDPGNPGNMAIVRARAEEVADQVQKLNLDPAEIGYVAVWLSLREAANQLRDAAHRRLTPEQLAEVADRLDALAEDTLLLGDAQTRGGYR